MRYVIPALYVIASYTFFLLPRLFGDVMELKLIAILLPFILGLVNLIVVLTVGRKWPRKTLLNCAPIIKYGLIPFYLVGGCLTAGTTILAIFPLPLMVLFGLVGVVFLIFGYGILLGSAPYSIAYLVKARKEGAHCRVTTILTGICQFFFTFDVLALIALTLKERHLVKTTIFVCIVTGISVLIGIVLIATCFVTA